MAVKSSEFRKLYRDLCNVNPSGVVEDISFEQDRKNIMRDLGYKMKGVPARVIGLKYHGATARRDANECRLKAIGSNYAETVRKKKYLHDLLVDSEKINKVTKEIQQYILEGMPVPNYVFDKLPADEAIIKIQMEAKMERAKRNKNSSSLLPGQKNVVALPPLSKTRQRQPINIMKDFTLTRWSREERDLLNKLYHEVPRPSNKKKMDSWKIYYISISSRFKEFFPERKQIDIEQKLEEMITKRQFKELGETDYWKESKSP
jgi:NAD+--asparagine ADP-ribosyltransferase